MEEIKATQGTGRHNGGLLALACLLTPCSSWSYSTGTMSSEVEMLTVEWSLPCQSPVKRCDVDLASNHSDVCIFS